MSIDRNVYVGPFIELLDTERTVMIATPLCKKLGCYRYNIPQLVGKYCSFCGTPLTVVDVPKKSSIDVYGILEDAGMPDILTSVGHEHTDKPNKHYLVSNHASQGGVHADEWQDVIEVTDEILQAKGPDWQTVENVLKSKGIKYRRSAGVVVWTS